MWAAQQCSILFLTTLQQVDNFLPRTTSVNCGRTNMAALSLIIQRLKRWHKKHLEITCFQAIFMLSYVEC